MGAALIVDATFHVAYFRIQAAAGFLLIMAVSWMKRARDEVSDDMDEETSVASDPNLPNPEVAHPVTLEKAKRLRRGEQDSLAQPRLPCNEAAGTAFDWHFSTRLLSLIVVVCALLAYFIASNPSIPSFIVLLVSPGTLIGAPAVYQYGSTAFPSGSTLGINMVYYGAIFWLFFRRKATANANRASLR